LKCNSTEEPLSIDVKGPSEKNCCPVISLRDWKKLFLSQFKKKLPEIEEKLFHRASVAAFIKHQLPIFNPRSNKLRREPNHSNYNKPLPL